MYRIAVIEDTPEDRILLKEFLERYQRENNVRFQVTESENGLAFIEHYRADYDVIFLDIEMPRLDGISLARQLRSRDENVCLIFTTCSARYAVEGYEVRALDYILKPVEYSVFAIKLQRALEIRKQRSAKELVISRSGGVQRVRLEDIHYIEIMNHTLYYHTWLEQQVYEERGSIADREKELAAYGFARCSTSFLLNLRYVTSVSGQVVISGGKEFPISRTKRKDFLQKLTDYLGEICL